MHLVYITCGGVKEAKKIAFELLKKRLIACANIVPRIDSFYWWNGRIESAKEALLLCKTARQKIPGIKKLVKKIHSYDVPCIEFIEISGQNKEYFDWLNGELKAQKNG